MSRIEMRYVKRTVPAGYNLCRVEKTLQYRYWKLQGHDSEGGSEWKTPVETDIEIEEAQDGK